MPIEVCVKRLLRGLEHQMTIVTMPDVAFNYVSHARRKPAF